MAIINCPECGKEISDKAIACPNCGMPIASKKDDVLIRFPVCEGQLFNNRCYVYDKKAKKILASGKQGETLSFICKKPTLIYVVANGFFGKPEVIAYPGDRFDVGYRALGKIYLSKVDAISGNGSIYRR